MFLTKLISLYLLVAIQSNGNLDYTHYHQQIVEVETLVASEKYDNALQIYESLFEQYEFVFLRDYQIATQLALHIGDETKAILFLKKGIESGWEMKAIKQNKFLNKLRKSDEWKSIQEQYPDLHEKYEATLNKPVRKKVKKMFSKDQSKAFAALFTFSSDGQDKYAERKFAPHSEEQLKNLMDVFNQFGYPGEKLIGNDYWMSTILSHHNSISAAYNTKDTLYQSIQPKLWNALKTGEISSFEYVIIDEWYRMTTNQKLTYGIIQEPLKKDLDKINELRKSAFIRPIAVHNDLVDIETKTGMNFYLDGHPLGAGKIEIR